MKGFVPNPVFPDRYLINKQGQIYSIFSKKMVAQRLDRYGYPRCNLYRNKKQKTVTIHRMVALAFIPNPHNLPEVNHKDGNKLNNDISNLEWVTSSENQKHAFDTGLQKGNKGESNGVAKYKEEDVIVVCELLGKGYSNAKITRETGFSRSFVEKIKYGETWLHITKHYGIKPKTKRATTSKSYIA